MAIDSNSDKSPVTKPRLCPGCRKAPSSTESGIRPFCSKRCKLVDLGAWASGSYLISSPISEDDIAELLEGSEEEDFSIE